MHGRLINFQPASCRLNFRKPAGPCEVVSLPMVGLQQFKCCSLSSYMAFVEMGLGKTIMVAALIQANQPRSPTISGLEARAAPSISSGDDSQSDDNDDSDKPYIPSPLGKHKLQTRLQPKGANDPVAGHRVRAGRYNATLVIAPTSLLTQWRDELLRSCSGNLNILVYNDQKDSSHLVQELDGGVDIVIASYGKIGIEYEKVAGADGKSFTKKPREGIYTVDWFRVILDEVRLHIAKNFLCSLCRQAHNIKSRSTRAAKACYAIRAKRRWCLTGTPIVNRLEDLYSLLHFIRCEQVYPGYRARAFTDTYGRPWGNWAMFNSFVTIPFQQKSPKALEVIQSVLEMLLLRREKSMKDKDGEPIVPLPKKRFIMVRAFC